MENYTNITMIPTEKLLPHPDNPRKDLGDLTEMVESVKKNGIMQNLTVVPDPKKPDCYRVVIGHRRRAAAIRAGLDELPCRIVEDMDEKTQLGVMLEENMQRNDLTVMEQAEGFARMLELGVKPAEIAERTGFSESTVYHRLNIAKLDKQAVTVYEKEGYQLTIQDMIALEKVKDIKEREKILREADGPKELRWRAENAARAEFIEKNKRIATATLEKDYGIMELPDSMKQKFWSLTTETLLVIKLSEKLVGTEPLDMSKLPKTKIKAKDVYWRHAYGDELTVLRVISKKEKEEKKTQEQLEMEAREKVRKQIAQMWDTLHARIRGFIMYMLERSIGFDKDLADIDMLLRSAILRDGMTAVKGYRELAAYFSNEKSYWDVTNEEIEKQKLWMVARPIYGILIASWHIQVKSGPCVDYNGYIVEENAKRVRILIEELKKNGFVLEDDEEELVNGTHPLYRKKETENADNSQI